MRRLIGLSRATTESALLRVNRATVAVRLKDVDSWIQDIVRRVLPFTMTSPERIVALCKAVEYVVVNRIPGDFVECGVWRGGSSMAAALSFAHFGQREVGVHLYDTFEGMSAPGAHDLQAQSGVAASELLSKAEKKERIWCVAGLEDVQQNLGTTGYPGDQITYVRGKVEETIPRQTPDRISILRLDTDWYESTAHELAHLYPAAGGRRRADHRRLRVLGRRAKGGLTSFSHREAQSRCSTR